MQLEELLAPLPSARVKLIAQGLELTTTGLGRDAIVARIAGALGLLPDGGGRQVLLRTLSLQDCRAVLLAYVDDPAADPAGVRAQVEALSEHPAPPLRALAPSARAGQAIFSHAFVPGLLALWALAWLLRARVPFNFLTPVLLGSLLVIGVAERLYPANAAWNYRLLSGDAHGWRQLGRDLLYLFAIAQVSVLVVAQVSPLLARLLPAHLSPLGSWPLPLRVAVAFLSVELASYWLHRAAHAIPLLWRFHSTHHVITELTGLKALRTHPVDNVLFALVRTVPLLLLGASTDEVVAVTYLASVLSLLAHANVIHADTPLGLLVNLPRYHAVHHSADEAESRSNFGCHTILWDRLFGTFRRHPDAGIEIGVRPVGPRTLWQELIAPFYR
jgi:sterol desaturase/sphingolipid hydroxylase (fatty acid hydroxylase superfamily)